MFLKLGVYILIYPQGCDVCNHLSLFLCIANHDKLLPGETGWSHFAQFTIAVVNKYPKKSKHSCNLLHLLIHYTGFGRKSMIGDGKKFIELPKLQDGFISDSDFLIIKAQVQGSERVDRPFRCLFCQYRKELVRVYMSNVEQSCGRFLEEKRSKLVFHIYTHFLRFENEILNSCCGGGLGFTLVCFATFWVGLNQNLRCQMSQEKMDEVTSTLVMDSLYSGLKALEGQTKNKKSRPRLLDTEELPAPFVSVEKDMFVLVDDVLVLIEKAVLEPLPLKEEKDPQNRTKDGNVVEYRTEAIERDEKRLTELGRQTVKIFVLAHIFRSRKEKQQKKRKKSKKKQAKQKKNKNRGKEKRKEVKVRSQTEERDLEKEECVRAKAEPSAEKPDTLVDVSDVSDSVDSSADIHYLDSEERESSHVHWEKDASEIYPLSLGDTNRGRGSSISIPNGVAERKCLYTIDDKPKPCFSDAKSLASETEDQPSRHTSNPKNQSHASKVRRVGEADVVISNVQEPERRVERNPISKDHSTVQTQEKSPVILISPRAAPWNLTSVAQAKSEKNGVSNYVDSVPNRRPISARSPSSDQASPSRDIQLQTVAPRSDVQKTASPKPTAQPAAPSMLRPLSAPIIPSKQAPPVISAVQTSTTSFARSMSSTGRIGSLTHSQTYTPQSYKHAIIGSSGFNHLNSQLTGKSAFSLYSHPSPISVSNQPGFTSQAGSWDISSSGLLWTGLSSSREIPTTTINRNHGMNPYNTTPLTTSIRPTRTTHSLMTDEFPHLDIINDLLEDGHGGFMGTSVYCVPQWFNMSRSYSDDGFHQSYGGEYLLHSSSSSSPYGNDDAASAAASNYSYFDLDSLNPNLSAGINGYRDFRPLNGH
ncbi:hypothetical protein EUTSA_v10003141mg [Eutrema salsugineum]|nr:hypothetical protein EUTSA_v10003141mg [Eutrema salsugineum]